MIGSIGRRKVLVVGTSYVDNTSISTGTSTVPACELTVSNHSEYIDYYSIICTYDYKVDASDWGYFDRLNEIKQGWKNPPVIGNVMKSKYLYKNMNIRDKLRRNKIRINEVALN
jgi:hypothetical protein